MYMYCVTCNVCVHVHVCVCDVRDYTLVLIFFISLGGGMSRLRRFERAYACRRKLFSTRTAPEIAVETSSSFGRSLKMKVSQIC